MTGNMHSVTVGILNLRTVFWFYYDLFQTAMFIFACKYRLRKS